MDRYVVIATSTRLGVGSIVALSEDQLRRRAYAVKEIIEPAEHPRTKDIAAADLAEGETLVEAMQAIEFKRGEEIAVLDVGQTNRADLADLAPAQSRLGARTKREVDSKRKAARQRADQTRKAQQDEEERRKQARKTAKTAAQSKSGGKSSGGGQAKGGGKTQPKPAGTADSETADKQRAGKSESAQHPPVE